MVALAHEREWEWTRAELWAKWRGQFASDDEAIAVAVAAANRQIKQQGKAMKAKFYSIKDEFIRRYGRDGWLAREEKRVCYACNGSGLAWGGVCLRCDGTGLYLTRRLYLHEFKVEGTLYQLHSYVEPPVMVEERTDESYRVIDARAQGLPMTGLMRILSYVAAAKWGMQMVDGRYV